MKSASKKNSRSEKQGLSNLEWQETFDAALDVFALISPQFEILKINKAGYQNLGKKSEDLIEKKCYEVVHGLKSPIKGCPCEKTLKTKTGGVGEIQDHGRCYIATASPVFNEKNEIIAFAHTIKDITEMKEAEKVLKQAKDDLEHKVKERTAELEQINKQMGQEIEERKKVEIALRKSEKTLQKQGLALSQKNIAL